MEMSMPVAIGIVFILGAAFVTDLKRGIIPNALTFPAIVTGWIYHTMENGIRAGLSAVGVSLLALGLLGLLYLFRAVGAGDVKLFMALGAWAGMHWMLMILIGSVFLCGVFGIIVIIGRSFYTPWRTLKHLPMMYAVFPAAWVVAYVI